MVTTSPSRTANRPATTALLVGALILGALLDFAHIGAAQSGAYIPTWILVLKVVFGIGALAAAAGLVVRQRWAAPLALIIAVPNLALGLWGFSQSLIDAGSTAEKVVTGLGVLISLIVIALAAPRASRRAVA